MTVGFVFNWGIESQSHFLCKANSAFDGDMSTLYSLQFGLCNRYNQVLGN